MPKRSRKRSERLTPIKTLEKRLDAALSLYVRSRGLSCVTCGKELPYEARQCGHFIKRQHKATRWDIRNVAVQCARCNLFLGGAQDEFANFLLGKIGRLDFEDLME